MINYTTNITSKYSLFIYIYLLISNFQYLIDTHILTMLFLLIASFSYYFFLILASVLLDRVKHKTFIRLHIIFRVVEYSFYHKIVGASLTGQCFTKGFCVSNCLFRYLLFLYRCRVRAFLWILKELAV